MLVPIAAVQSSSGTVTSTSQPRARSASASVAALARDAARRAASGRVEPASVAVGFRQTTRAPRRTGAASRFVALQTPPSTYSRPSIPTGANSQGTEQDASTASTTLAGGAPGSPNMT